MREDRRIREHVVEKTLDLLEFTFDVDLDRRRLAQIPHVAGDGVRFGDFEHVIAEADVLHAPADVDEHADDRTFFEFVHVPLFVARRCRSREGRPLARAMAPG